MSNSLASAARTNALLAFLTACVQPPAPTSGTLVGRVFSESGSSLPGAAVCSQDTQGCVTTDGTGTYALTAFRDRPQVLTFSNPGYASQTRPVAPAAHTISVLLRPIGAQVVVTMPEGGAPPVAVTTTRGDAGATLSIGPGDLVDRESGAPVHGDFNVTMTLWNPAESLTSAPAVLLADSPGAGAPTPLVSFGMAQLELTQNGNRLQVAPGAQLDLHLREPAAAQSAMTRPALRGMPNLYSLDEVSGLWHLEGTVDSGALAYDAATGTFSARLPHLSNWNVDIPADQVALTPTCVQGTVKNSCPAAAGAPLADSNVTVWFMGFEQLKDLHAKSDANGHYCIGDYLSFIGSQGKQNVRYFVSGASYTDTSMFSGGTQNPYPASCFDCEKTGETFDDRGYTYSWCSDCSCNDCMDADTAASGLTSGNAIYYPTTGAGSAVLAGHTSCSQGNCVQLQDVALAGPACAVPGTVPPPADPCQAATAKFLGDTCVPGDVCCSDSGAGGLTCADYLCVPVAEP